GDEGLLQLLGEAEVVHDEAAGLVSEHAVHARDRLHEPVAPHRLVHVHRVERWRVETRQPHVPHQDDPEGIAWIPEPTRQRLAARLVADVRLPVERIGRRARHDDLDSALDVVVVLPGGSQGDDLTVQLDTDPATHAHYHRLAVYRLKPFLEMPHDVLGDDSEPLVGPDDRLELRPLRLELLLSFHLFTFGDFVEA